MPSRQLGQPEKANNPVPYIPGWITGFRAAPINADDGAPDETRPIGLDKSRFGVGNVIAIDVIATGTGVVLTLWAKEGADLIAVATSTTTLNKQRVIFKDLLATVHYLQVTGAVGKAVVLNVGATQ